MMYNDIFPSIAAYEAYEAYEGVIVKRKRERWAFRNLGLDLSQDMAKSAAKQEDRVKINAGSVGSDDSGEQCRVVAGKE